MRSFESLSEREILALAISLEEEDERIYADFADGLRENFPATAEVFDGMREGGVRPPPPPHRAFTKARFGDHIPLIRRQDVSGFVHRKPVWLVAPAPPRHACAARPPPWKWRRTSFYERPPPAPATPASASCSTTWPQEERSHEGRAEELERDNLGPERAARG